MKISKERIKQLIRENLESSGKLKEYADKVSSNMYCDRFGSCVHFAELFIEKISKNDPNLLGDFNVVSGYVTTNNGKFEHTWIELKNGEKIDPTFEQFIGKVKNITKKRTYKGYEYLSKTNDTWFKERRKEFPQHVYKNITVYHGTKPKFVNAILNNGLIDKTGYNQKNYMISTDFESALFHADSEEDEKVYVIEFEVPIEDTKWFGYPYFWKGEKRNDDSTWFALKQPIPKEFIKNVHEIDYEDWLEQKNLGF